MSKNKKLRINNAIKLKVYFSSKNILFELLIHVFDKKRLIKEIIFLEHDSNVKKREEEGGWVMFSVIGHFWSEIMDGK